jgi:hypothetical protein
MRHGWRKGTRHRRRRDSRHRYRAFAKPQRRERVSACPRPTQNSAAFCFSAWPQRAATEAATASATWELDSQLVLAVDCPGLPVVTPGDAFDSLQEWLWPTVAP